MKNHSYTAYFILLFMVAPGVYYFISGEHFENSIIRNSLVGVQILGGLVLVFIYSRKTDQK